jgi:hypothetical protein
MKGANCIGNFTGDPVLNPVIYTGKQVYSEVWREGLKFCCV